MITIGLTGQTGAGKSTFADYLRRKYGFVHIDTDKISREVIKTKTAELAAMFGSDVLNPDGTPNRKMIAKRAFSSRLGKFALNLAFLRASKTPIKAPPLAFLKLMS